MTVIENLVLFILTKMGGEIYHLEASDSVSLMIIAHVRARGLARGGLPVF
jgi:hypothetical protein